MPQRMSSAAIKAAREKRAWGEVSRAYPMDIEAANEAAPKGEGRAAKKHWDRVYRDRMVIGNARKAENQEKDFVGRKKKTTKKLKKQKSSKACAPGDMYNKYQAKKNKLFSRKPKAPKTLSGPGQFRANLNTTKKMIDSI